MSTGYTFSLGYNSGDSFKGHKDEAWHVLVETIEQIQHHPERIVAEARRLGAPEVCEQGCCTLQSLAEAYQQPDNIIFIDHKKRYVLQLASGERAQKVQVRRAFCRLVIEEMHKRGIEVNLNVV